MSEALTVCLLDESGRPAVRFVCGAGAKRRQRAVRAMERGLFGASAPLVVRARSIWGARADDSVEVLWRKLVCGTLADDRATAVYRDDDDEDEEKEGGGEGDDSGSEYDADADRAAARTGADSLSEWRRRHAATQTPAAAALRDMLAPAGAAARGANLYMFAARPRPATKDWLAAFRDLELSGRRRPMTAGTWLALLANWIHWPPGAAAPVPLDKWALERAPDLFTTPDAQLHFDSARERLALPEEHLWQWAPLGLRRTPRAAAGSAALADASDVTAVSPIAARAHDWPAVAAPPISAQMHCMRTARSGGSGAASLMDASAFSWYPEPADAVFRACGGGGGSGGGGSGGGGSSDARPAVVFAYTAGTLRARLQPRLADAQMLLDQFFFATAVPVAEWAQATELPRLRAEAALARAASTAAARGQGLLQHGVVRLQFVLHPTRRFRLPLQPVFNVVHASRFAPAVVFADAVPLVDASAIAAAAAAAAAGAADARAPRRHTLRLFTDGRTAPNGRPVPVLSQRALTVLTSEFEEPRRVRGPFIMFCVPLAARETWIRAAGVNVSGGNVSGGNVNGGGRKSAASASSSSSSSWFETTVLEDRRQAAAAPAAAAAAAATGTEEEQQQQQLDNSSGGGEGRMLLVALYESGHLEVKTQGTGYLEEPVAHTDLDAWLQFHLRPVCDALNLVLGQAGLQLRSDLSLEDDNLEILELDWRAAGDQMLAREPYFWSAASAFLAREEGGGGGGGGGRAAAAAEQLFRYTRVEFYRPMTAFDTALLALVRSVSAQLARGGPQRPNSVSALMVSDLRRRFPGASEEEVRTAVVGLHAQFQPIPSARFFGQPVRAELRASPGLRVRLVRQSEHASVGRVTVEGVRDAVQLRFLAGYFNAALRRAAVKRAAAPEGAPAPAPTPALQRQPRIAPQTPESARVDRAARRMFQRALDIVPEEEEEYGEASASAVAEEEEAVDENFTFFGMEDEDEGSEDEGEGSEESEGGEDNTPPLKRARGGGGKGVAVRRAGEPAAAGTAATGTAGEAYTLVHMKRHYAEVNPMRYKKSYFPRTCQGRHPNLLTQSQLDRVQSEYAGAATKPITSVMRHGTSTLTGEPLYWTCARFWCTKPGREGPLTEAQANDPGVCGQKVPVGEQPRDQVWVMERSAKSLHIGMTEPKAMQLRADGSTVAATAPCCFDSRKLAAAKTDLARAALSGDGAPKKGEGEGEGESEGEGEGESEGESEGEGNVAVKVRRQVTGNAVQVLQKPGRWPLQPRGIGHVDRTGALQQLLRTPAPRLDRDKPTVGAPAFLVRYGLPVRPEQEAADNPVRAARLAAESQHHADQSFLACLAYGLFGASPDAPRAPTLRELRRRIVDAVHLDLFVRLNNATLVQLFCGQPQQQPPRSGSGSGSGSGSSGRDDDAAYPPVRSSEHAMYAESTLVRSLDLTGSAAHRAFYRKVAAAHRRFLAYLRDETRALEPTYLWELVAMPGPLSAAGLNLVMFERAGDGDDTAYRLVCPQQSYLTQTFDPAKPSVLLLRQPPAVEDAAAAGGAHHWYDLLALFSVRPKTEAEAGSGVAMQARFALRPDSADPVARALHLRLAELLARAPCGATFADFSEQTNLPAERVRDQVLAALGPENGARLRAQVLNFQGKCVGLFFEVTVGGGKGKGKQQQPSTLVVVPTFPSAQLTTSSSSAAAAAAPKIVYQDDPRLFEQTTYAAAVLALRYVHARAGVPCLPAARVVSEGMVVGVATQTQQLVRVKPEPHAPRAHAAEDGGLPATFTTETDDAVDAQALLPPPPPPPVAGEAGEAAEDAVADADPHAHMVLAVQLDGDMYDAFAQAARAALNQHENRKARKRLQRLGLERAEGSLRARRKQVVAALRALLLGEDDGERPPPPPVVEFVDVGVALPAAPAAARRVLVNARTRAWLRAPETGALVLPARLFAHPAVSTAGVFFLKLADALLRHKWQQVLLFHPEVVHLYGVDRMEQRTDEIVVALPSLTEDYFRSLEAGGSAERAAGLPAIYDFRQAPEQLPPPPRPVI